MNVPQPPRGKPLATLPLDVMNTTNGDATKTAPIQALMEAVAQASSIPSKWQSLEALRVALEESHKGSSSSKSNTNNQNHCHGNTHKNNACGAKSQRSSSHDPQQPQILFPSSPPTAQQCVQMESMLLWHTEESLRLADPTLLPVALAGLALVHQWQQKQTNPKSTKPHPQHSNATTGVSVSTTALLLQCWKVYRYDAHILRPLMRCWRQWAKQTPHRANSLWVSRAFLERLGLALTMEWIIHDPNRNNDNDVNNNTNTNNNKNDTNTGNLRTQVWGLLKDITFRAWPEDKRILFHEYGAILLNAIVQGEASIPSMHNHTNNNNNNHNAATSIVTDHAIASVWNLALVPDISVAWATTQPLLWTALRHLHQPSVNLTIRTKATAALGTILSHCTTTTHHHHHIASSATSNNHTSLATSTTTFSSSSKSSMSTDNANSENKNASILDRNTSDLEWIVPDLLTGLRDISDADWRRRALRTLRCLVGSDWGRALTHASGQSLYDALFAILNDSQQPLEARTHVGYVFARLVSDPDGIIGPQLEPALLHLLTEPSAPSALVPSCLAALSACIRYRTEYGCNATAIFADSDDNNDKLYANLNRVLQDHMDDPAYHIAMAEWMETVTTTATTNSATETNTTTNRKVLDLWTKFLTPVGPAFEPSRATSLRLVQTRMQINDGGATKSKHALAEHPDLLGALVQVCLVTSGSTKALAKQLVLELVPEL